MFDAVYAFPLVWEHLMVWKLCFLCLLCFSIGLGTFDGLEIMCFMLFMFFHWFGNI